MSLGTSRSTLLLCLRLRYDTLHAPQKSHIWIDLREEIEGQATMQSSAQALASLVRCIAATLVRCIAAVRTQLECIAFAISEVWTHRKPARTPKSGFCANLATKIISGCHWRTTTKANLNLSFESKILVYSNANISFQERIITHLLKKLSYQPDFAHFLAKSQPPHGQIVIHGHQEMLKTSVKVPNCLRISKRVQRNKFTAVKHHTWDLFGILNMPEFQDFPEFWTSTRDQGRRIAPRYARSLSWSFARTVWI